MNDESIAWFHCGRCGSLFKTSAGGAGNRPCTACGEDPALGLEADQDSGIKTPKDPLLKVKMAEVEKPTVRKREVRRRKTNHFALKLVIGWTLALIILGVAVNVFWKTPERESQTVTDSAIKGTLADLDVALLTKAYPKCREQMGGFLAAGTPEVRSQFVRSASENAGKMARYYQMNPMDGVDPQMVRGAGSGVIALGDRRAIETRWKTTDGKEFDAVFLEEKGEWKLDWEDYVRFGDQPWAIFMTGGGEDVGEFRLFARERMPEQRSEVSKLRVQLYAPRFGQPAETGEASPEILIDQESKVGEMIKAALSERAAGNRIFGSTLPNHDPDGMVRLRVKVRRSEGPAGREFTIEEVLACHWLSVPETGVKP